MKILVNHDGIASYEGALTDVLNAIGAAVFKLHQLALLFDIVLRNLNFQVTNRHQIRVAFVGDGADYITWSVHSF